MDACLPSSEMATSTGFKPRFELGGDDLDLGLVAALAEPRDESISHKNLRSSLGFSPADLAGRWNIPSCSRLVGAPSNSFNDLRLSSASLGSLEGALAVALPSTSVPPTGLRTWGILAKTRDGLTLVVSIFDSIDFVLDGPVPLRSPR